MNRTCLAVAAAAVVAVAVAAPGAAGSGPKDLDSPRLAQGLSSTVANGARLRRPRGFYSSQGGRVQLSVAGGRIEIAAIAFGCGDVTGRTALNDVPVVRRRGRYRFSISAHGGVTYSDEESPDNAAIRLSGRFTPKAGRAIGTFSVRTPRCGRTGPVEFSARRR